MQSTLCRILSTQLLISTPESYVLLESSQSGYTDYPISSYNKTIRGQDYDTLYFRDKITEAQRGSMTWSWEHSQNVAKT